MFKDKNGKEIKFGDHVRTNSGKEFIVRIFIVKPEGSFAGEVSLLTTNCNDLEVFNPDSWEKFEKDMRNEDCARVVVINKKCYDFSNCKECQEQFIQFMIERAKKLCKGE